MATACVYPANGQLGIYLDVLVVQKIAQLESSAKHQGRDVPGNLRPLFLWVSSVPFRQSDLALPAKQQHELDGLRWSKLPYRHGLLCEIHCPLVHVNMKVILRFIAIVRPSIRQLGKISPFSYPLLHRSPSQAETSSRTLIADFWLYLNDSQALKRHSELQGRLW